MEFVGGGDLGAYIRKCHQFNKVPKEQTISLLIAETVMGLDYLHEMKIYHRDIKPENILITSTVRIIISLTLGPF